jgi:2,3-bisphosphoglycerate-dependent phosphoglycerate mutase
VPRLILVRHGQSQWNLENRFTGWWDVDLTPKGEAEARAAGALLKEKGILPTVAFTSFQTRAIRTLHLALEAAGRVWIPKQGLAPQRAPLWRPDRPRQGRNRRQAWR